MSIKSRILAIISAARTVRQPATPAPIVVPVFPMVITQQDDVLTQVSRLRSQGYSLRAVASEMGISYRQARKLSAAGEAAGNW